MELRTLRYFIAVARKENITDAAEYLGITQPTLSRQMMELEDELGETLFVRGKRNAKISLTEKGMFLRKRAEEIIELCDKTERDFDTDNNALEGDVYIGGGETFAMEIIAKTAKRLQKMYKNIRYHLFSGNADDVTERLDKGLIDFGILIEPASVEKYNYIKLPITDVWGVLVHKDSALAKKAFLKAKDLEDIPLIVSRQSMSENEISGWLKKDLGKLNIVATYNLLYNASIMVKEGLGSALCLDKIINTKGSSLCFRELRPKLHASLYIISKKYHTFSKASEKFMDEIHEVIREQSMKRK